MVVLRPQEVLFRSETGQGFNTVYDRKHPPFRGGGIQALAPFGNQLIRNMAVGAAGNALRGLARIGDVPKDQRQQYLKGVVRNIVNPTNLIALPTAATLTQHVASRLLSKK